MIPIKLNIYRERLNRGGYTSSGRYFGVGEKLWSWETEGLPRDEYGWVRASTKAAARAAAMDVLRAKGIIPRDNPRHPRARRRNPYFSDVRTQDLQGRQRWEGELGPFVTKREALKAAAVAVRKLRRSKTKRVVRVASYRSPERGDPGFYHDERSMYERGPW